MLNDGNKAVSDSPHDDVLSLRCYPPVVRVLHPQRFPHLIHCSAYKHCCSLPKSDICTWIGGGLEMRLGIIVDSQSTQNFKYGYHLMTTNDAHFMTED